jgi:hypothetical protein
MNIIDVCEDDIRKLVNGNGISFGPDRLENMFAVQNALMVKYGVKKLDINTKEGQAQARMYAWFMVEELFEAMNLLKLRPWAKQFYETDQNRLDDEMADFLGFFFQVMVLLGYDAKRVYESFLKKMVVNEFRIRSEY